MTINYKKGDKIGECIFLEDTDCIIKYTDKDRTNYFRYAKFQCICGKEFESLIQSVKNGKTKSCGCLRIKVLRTRKHYIKHGAAIGYINTPEYNAWLAMKARCKETNTDKSLYFDKGIQVCERWDNKYNGFQNFLSDMGEKPSKEHSLDRINGNKGYFQENCRWATSYEQSGNRSSNIMISYKEVTKCLGHWAKEYNLSYSTLKYRIRKGWDVEKALITPAKETRR